MCKGIRGNCTVGVGCTVQSACLWYPVAQCCAAAGEIERAQHVRNGGALPTVCTSSSPLRGDGVLARAGALGAAYVSAHSAHAPGGACHACGSTSSNGQTESKQEHELQQNLRARAPGNGLAKDIPTGEAKAVHMCSWPSGPPQRLQLSEGGPQNRKMPAYRKVQCMPTKGR
jgi:hypothetical protein